MAIFSNKVLFTLKPIIELLLAITTSLAWIRIIIALIRIILNSCVFIDFHWLILGVAVGQITSFVGTAHFKSGNVFLIKIL